MRKPTSPFDVALWEEIQPFLHPPAGSKEEETLARAVFKNLSGEAFQDAALQRAELRSTGHYVVELFFARYEVEVSLDRMKMAALLIKQYPALPSWKEAGITKEKYFRYHLEYYINEVNIFKERVAKLLGYIKNSCTKVGWVEGASEMEDLRTIFKESLRALTGIRHDHVHVRRYKDMRIDQLEGLEIFGERIPELEPVADDVYRTLRKRYSSAMFKEVSRLEEELDRVLDRAKAVAFKPVEVEVK